MGDFFLGAGALLFVFTLGLGPISVALGRAWGHRYRRAAFKGWAARIYLAIIFVSWPAVAWCVMRDLIDDLEAGDGR